ncbi:MAG: DUF1700 domain-containing protein [Bifidobacteriaceae bacterium]|jgi:uncharacterized membrane protein|nr:DUF1700 domain-containing protein [Bifidobacteriaceae bacterium]
MNAKTKWLKQFREALLLLGASEPQIKEILSEFERHFQEADSNLTEEQIANNLGQPFEIAKEYIENDVEKNNSETNSEMSKFGLIVLDVFVFSWVIPVTVIIVLTFWAVILALTVGATVYIIINLVSSVTGAGWFYSAFEGVAYTFGIVGMIFFGLLLVYPLIKFTQLEARFLVGILNYHKRIFDSPNRITPPTLSLPFFKKRWHIISGAGLACAISLAGVFVAIDYFNPPTVSETKFEFPAEVENINVNSPGSIEIEKTAGQPYMTYQGRNIQRYQANYASDQRTLNLTNQNLGIFNWNFISGIFSWLGNHETENVKLYLPEKQYHQIKLSAVNDIDGNISGDSMTLENVSGDMKVSEIDSQTLVLSTVSGELSLNGATSSMNLHQVSGKSQINLEKLQPSTKIDIDYVSSDITLKLPKGSGVNVDADLVSGDLSYDLNGLKGHAENDFTYPGNPVVDIKIQGVSGGINLQN